MIGVLYMYNYYLQTLEFSRCKTISVLEKLVSPDNHFDRVDSDAQASVLRDDERHTAAAVGHLGAEVDPLP